MSGGIGFERTGTPADGANSPAAPAPHPSADESGRVSSAAYAGTDAREQSGGHAPLLPPPINPGFQGFAPPTPPDAQSSAQQASQQPSAAQPYPSQQPYAHSSHPAGIQQPQPPYQLSTPYQPQPPQQPYPGQLPGQYIPGQQQQPQTPQDYSSTAWPPPQANQAPAQVPYPQAPSGAHGAGFAVAQDFDGTNPDGSPVVNRPQLDPREIPALAAYLTQAPVALTAAGAARDELLPSAPPAIALAFHTDGFWIWSAAAGYYLTRYQLPPQAELLSHIRSRSYQLLPLPEHVRQAAAGQILAGMTAPSTPATQYPQQPPAQQEPQVPQPRQAPANAYAPTVLATPVPSAPESTPLGTVRPTSTPGQTVASPPDGLSPVTALDRFSDAFIAAGNRHSAWAMEQVDTLRGRLVPDRWGLGPLELDADRGFTQSGHRFTVDALGTVLEDGTWKWTWADGPGGETEQTRRLRDLGERNGIAELTAPTLDLSRLGGDTEPWRAAELLALAATGLLNARGYLALDALGGDPSEKRTYYVVCDTSVPEPKPSLGAVARFLMEGAAAFGGDAAECVLGYVDRHGWEWSRSGDAIVVTAQGVGSFTVQVSPEGRLTGLSLRT